MDGAVLALADRLHREHRPYVLATVVWSRAPSSGKSGGTALIEPDGSIHGWIGGACAEPTVIREARRAINDGTARLMYLGPADELDGNARDGVINVPISCASEGALEVFMEPVLPQPHVVVIGRSPAVRTLARLVVGLDWRATVIDDGGESTDMPDDAAVVTSLAEFDLSGSDAAAVVVATQGHYDEPALEAALAGDAPYIGLIASRTRSRSVLGYLRDRGLSDQDIARVHTPAGLDLGHLEHREIAVAVLAQLVSLKGRHELNARVGTAVVAAPATAVDPVCGMTLETAGARFTAELAGDMTGAIYYFCCPACRKSFVETPSDYATRPA